MYKLFHKVTLILILINAFTIQIEIDKLGRAELK